MGLAMSFEKYCEECKEKKGLHNHHVNPFISPEEFKKQYGSARKLKRGRGRPARVYGQRQKGWKEKPLI